MANTPNRQTDSQGNIEQYISFYAIPQQKEEMSFFIILLSKIIFHKF